VVYHKFVKRCGHTSVLINCALTTPVRPSCSPISG